MANNDSAVRYESQGLVFAAEITPAGGLRIRIPDMDASRRHPGVEIRPRGLGRYRMHTTPSDQDWFEVIDLEDEEQLGQTFGDTDRNYCLAKAVERAESRLRTVSAREMQRLSDDAATEAMNEQMFCWLEARRQQAGNLTLDRGATPATPQPDGA